METWLVRLAHICHNEVGQSGAMCVMANQLDIITILWLELRVLYHSQIRAFVQCLTQIFHSHSLIADNELQPCNCCVYWFMTLILTFVIWCLVATGGEKTQANQGNPEIVAKSYPLAAVIAATKNFKTQIGNSSGLQPIYFGKLANGKEVAVKVFTKGPRQHGLSQFSTEVNFRIHICICT